MLTLRIAAPSFDGVTPVDLANAILDPATEIYELVSAVPVGLVPFWTFPGFQGHDVWLQKISGTGGPVTPTYLFPSGQNLSMVTPPAPWNIALPQGSQVQLDSAMAAGTVTFWFYGLTERNWAPLTCCHQYAPAFQVAP